MSHFTTVKTEILDLDILKKTIADLGFRMKENDWRLGHDGQMEDIDLSVRISPETDLLFKKGETGKGYVITAFGKIAQQEKMRRIIQMVQQEYAYRKVLHETRKRGFSLVQEERVKAGVIKLVLKKVA
jgi:acetolactate synthase regulatory subunit